MKKLKKIMAGIMAMAMIGSLGTANASAAYYMGHFAPPEEALVDSRYGEDSLVFATSDFYTTANAMCKVISPNGELAILQQRHNENITIKFKDSATQEDIDSIPYSLAENFEDGTYWIKEHDRKTREEMYDVLKEYYEIEYIEETAEINVYTTDIDVDSVIIKTALSQEEFEEKYSDFYENMDVTESTWEYLSEENMNYGILDIDGMSCGETEEIKNLYTNIKVLIDSGVNCNVSFDRPESYTDETVDFTGIVYTSPEDGDLTEDHEINLYDVVEISKHIMGMNSLTEKQLKLGDINKDYICNLYDAVEIAKSLM